MPSFRFSISDAQVVSPANAAVFDIGAGGFILRRYDPATGKYDPTGRMFGAGAVIRTSDIPLAGVKELFAFNVAAGFDTDAAGNQLGSLLYRMSADNGDTWLYWDGSAWSTASTGEHFSSLAQMQANIGTFPLPSASAVQFRLEVKIIPDAARIFTPRLSDVEIGAEIHDRPFEDAVASVVTHLYGITSKLIVSNYLQETTSSVVFKGVWTRFDVQQVTRAYDLTDDPYRRVNLYSSYSPETGTVTLSQQVPMNHELEIEYTGKCPVSPLAEEELYEATLPHIGVVPLKTVLLGQLGNTVEIVTNRTKNLARVRIPSEVFEQRFRLYCVAARNEEALQISEAATRYLEMNVCRYLPTGEPMSLCDLDHPSNLDLEPRGMYSKQVEFSVHFRRYSPEYVQTSLVQSVTAAVTDTEQTTVYTQASSP